MRLVPSWGYLHRLPSRQLQILASLLTMIIQIGYSSPRPWFLIPDEYWWHPYEFHHFWFHWHVQSSSKTYSWYIRYPLVIRSNIYVEKTEFDVVDPLVAGWQECIDLHRSGPTHLYVVDTLRSSTRNCLGISGDDYGRYQQCLRWHLVGIDRNHWRSPCWTQRLVGSTGIQLSIDPRKLQ